MPGLLTIQLPKLCLLSVLFGVIISDTRVPLAPRLRLAPPVFAASSGPFVSPPFPRGSKAAPSYSVYAVPPCSLGLTSDDVPEGDSRCFLRRHCVLFYYLCLCCSDLSIHVSHRGGLLEGGCDSVHLAGDTPETRPSDEPQLVLTLLVEVPP